jgi:hypothetical protein
MRISVSPSVNPSRIVRSGVINRWAGVTACGLVLALAGAMGPPKGPATGGPAVRLVVALPDPLKAAILGLFALAALLLLVLLWPRGLRRRKKEDEEFRLVYEQPKVSPWALLLVLVLFLLPVALAAYYFWVAWLPAEPGVMRGPSPSGPSGHAGLLPHGPAPPFASAPLFTGAVASLAVIAGLGCLAVTLWIFLGDRIVGLWAGSPHQSRLPERLSEAVEESLDALRREPNARRAIIRCYRRFEQALAGCGRPRKPWETPSEFMKEALHQLRIPPDPVRTLTGLFEVSRFSHHPLGQVERDLALGSLVEIQAALGQGDTHAVTA